MTKRNRFLTGMAFSLGLFVTAPIVLADTPPASTQAAPTVTAPAKAATPVIGHPAMWVIKTANSTTYLLGSFHLMKPEYRWETAQITNAYTQASDITFEVPNLDDQAEAIAGIRKYGLYATPELDKHLTPEQYKKLDTLMAAHGLPLKSMLIFKPWLVAVTLSVKIDTDLGYDPKAGVDTTLMSRARADKKTVLGLETLDDQFRVLSHTDDQDGLSFLLSSLDEADEGPQKMTDMGLAWLMSDTDYLQTVFNKDMKDKYPEMYKKLLVERNANWVPEIQALTEKPGTHLVIAGAGHMVGPDSIRAGLKAKGLKVERIE